MHFVAVDVKSTRTIVDQAFSVPKCVRLARISEKSSKIRRLAEDTRSDSSILHENSIKAAVRLVHDPTDSRGRTIEREEDGRRQVGGMPLLTG